MKTSLLVILFFYIITCFAQTDNSSNYYSEKYRLQFHFTPKSKWMNDPNGLVYFNGKYHLFYQYYPYDIVWGPMHWGHAESADLLHWQHLPIALYPDSLGNIFSGSAVIDKNNTAGFGKNAMIAIFTYHNDSIWARGFKNTESQGIAYSLDEGISWKKYSGNPVLNNSGEQDFRDPKVFWNDEINLWNMVLAVGDRIKIFTSQNLKNWKFESDFKPVNDTANLGVWECPDLFKMKLGEEEKWIMIVNHGGGAPNGGSGTRYFVGNFDGKVFKNIQESIWLDYGTDFYAGVTFSNVPNNKNVLIAWMSNWQYATKTPTEVWRSAMTLPRELTLLKTNGHYVIAQKIVNQFSSLEENISAFENCGLPFHQEDFDLSQTEISFLNNAENLEIRISNKIGEQIKIELNDNILTVDRSKSGKIDFNENFANKVQTMPLSEQITSFQLILDKSSIEILLNNGKYSMTNLFFPNENFSIIDINSKGSNKISELKFNKINRVWN
ncbi:MAG: glycoside hydrolase family 32 protein [Ignavibacteriales bacterium]|nr:glycoside hydrolase family 32 protein [Ignavibacteriales bacterium]